MSTEITVMPQYPNRQEPILPLQGTSLNVFSPKLRFITEAKLFYRREPDWEGNDCELTILLLGEEKRYTVSSLIDRPKREMMGELVHSGIIWLFGLSLLSVILSECTDSSSRQVLNLSRCNSLFQACLGKDELPETDCPLWSSVRTQPIDTEKR